ncbi:acyl-CoA N-acyltransferase [Hypoxylon crocopeplum]|nr:acyl-CoA N-acyltransferase [Hypoxylon crocopeplum]
MDDEWTVDANEALAISLVRPMPSGIETIASFKPKFTYAIFGQDERIFGYKNLKINLRFDARDLRPHLSISSSKRFTSFGDVDADNIKDSMKDLLPGVALQSKQDFDQALKSIPDDWTPPGTLVKSFEKNGDLYEIWHGNLADLAVVQLVRRIQITVLLFIEAGSYVGIDAEGNDEPDYSLARWSVFFVYKKAVNPEAANQPQYTFQGYATVYKFWMFQQPTPPSSPGNTPNNWELPEGDYPLNNLPHRLRISQFVILPPFQKKGIGASLYDCIFELGMKTTFTKEVTVEDPNEDFDLLRDLCDLKYLRKNVPEFAKLEINPDVRVPEKGGYLHNNTDISLSPHDSLSNDGIVNIAKLEELRIKHKIAPRQFWRLVEMHLMSKLPDSVRPQADAVVSNPKASKADKHIYTLWRLLLKQRLYRRNRTILGEFEITERILKLNETLDNVEWEYCRILDRLDSKLPVANDPVVANDKRKSNGDAGARSPPRKKARVSDDL